MDTLNQFFTSDLSLWGLFISSFLAATLLPGGSEAVLFAVLKAYPETLWMALLIATVGNTLGGMVTFAMGWLLPQTRQLKYVEKLRPRHGGAEPSSAGVAASHLLPQREGGSEAAGHPPAYPLRVQTAGFASNVSKVRPRHGGAEPSSAGVAASHLLPQTAGFASNVSKVRRYGAPVLLIAWVPLIGDALCLAAGWLRLSWWQVALFMLLGKFARYWVIAVTIV